MSWLPTKPGWLEFHTQGTPSGVLAEDTCDRCEQTATHVASWPSHAPRAAFLCEQHAKHFRRIPSCEVTPITEGETA